ncbi:hypothetical protein [Pseudalkalibacillus berkeleyi]|uniref:Uncharacterized protein n=1 Tax=Pseudalkalibacillus berkeleyi TaxID=1069813 RepID=A0ABS9H0K1_9BACL|nr:hypothetical protein [Pseudalkalibacillus berkeleyi]MCF6137288.1 hypothetical protein [Pseudalkalibacillus berkeleyi]
MIRLLDGTLVSYINGKSILLKYLDKDRGRLSIEGHVIGDCPYRYTKEKITKIEQEQRQTKHYFPDEHYLYKELYVGTIIDAKV